MVDVLISMEDSWFGNKDSPLFFCYNLHVRKLTATLCLTIAVVLGNGGEG